MKTYRHKCGCQLENGERERYLELCPEHQAEFDARHQAHAAERDQARARLNSAEVAPSS